MVKRLTGYKLFRKRRDGSYGPLFINRKLKLEPGVDYPHEDHPTKGYAHRPGWHICRAPNAPHLSERGRVWCEVEFEPMSVIFRPENQGGVWHLGRSMKIVRELDTNQYRRAA
jgi:hypothetical protein